MTRTTTAEVSAGVGDSESLRVKLIWLTMFRTVATTLLLTIVALRLLGRPPEEELSRADSLSFVVIGFVYVLNLVYGVLLRRGWTGRSAAYIQVLGDVVIASSLAYLTGGGESPFTFTYSLAVVAASILLQQEGAFVAAAASSLAFAMLVGGVQKGWFSPPTGAGFLSPARVAFSLASNVLAQFLTAALASYLSRQLSHAGGMLSAREADLQQLNRLQRQILACMPSGLLTCNSEGEMTFVNPAGAHILGIDENTEHHMNRLLPGVREMGEGKRREVTIETSAGRRVLGLSATSLEGEQGGALLIVFSDLTDLRRMQIELQRVDRLAALGTLSAQLAHEIRNPLAAMRGSAQMLAGEPQASPSAVRLTTILVREADRLSRLVEDFLRFARPPKPTLKTASLLALVQETVEMVRTDPLAERVELQLDLDEIHAAVDGDQLKQVLLNLLRNAIQAAGAGGRVRVVLEEDAKGIQLRVWDSAGSIPPADLERIFEPFFTTRAGGTGLGLSTAHSIVQAHGGGIEVTSSPETGTEFTVGLIRNPPLSEAAVAHSGGG